MGTSFSRGLIVSLAVAGAIAHVESTLAQPLRDSERPERPSTTTPREGGIPRASVAPEREDDRREGHEEGMPQLDTRSQGREFQPRWAPPRSDWRLGVWGYNTDTGVVITRVARGSAAESRGLEPGDRIISVGGYQVGYVGDYLYPLGHELQRQAGRRGDVLLLVQNVRNRELVNLDVQLDRADRPRPFPAPRPARSRFDQPPREPSDDSPRDRGDQPPRGSFEVE